MKKSIILFILIIILITGCAVISVKNEQELNKPEIEMAEAKQVLDKYLNFLFTQQYEQALSYYGGDFAYLEQSNPDIKPEFKAKLLEHYCLLQKGICLKPMIINELVLSQNEYKFDVQYFNNDGSLYATPGCPCKGGGKNTFELRVKKDALGKLMVFDLPPKE